MTLGFLLFAAGLALLASALKKQSVADILKGAIGPDAPIFTPKDYGSVQDQGAPAGPTGPGGLDYVNPFGGARVKIGRTDQGVDLTGSGPIRALGDAIITDVAAFGSGSGWPEGGYVEYKLASGPRAGQSIFVAEGISPAVRKGQHVQAGETIAHFHGRSIETGFAEGGTRRAAAHAGYVKGKPTTLGMQFRSFLRQLGV